MSTLSNLDQSVLIAALESLLAQVKSGAISADPRTFSTGSIGFYLNAKLPVTIGGEAAKIQAGCNLVVCGSNPNKPAKAPKAKGNPTWDALTPEQRQARIDAMSAKAPTVVPAPEAKPLVPTRSQVADARKGTVIASGVKRR